METAIPLLIVLVGLAVFHRSLRNGQVRKLPERPQPMRSSALAIDRLGLTPTGHSAGLASSAGKVAKLRQNLRLKVMYDESKIDRLVDHERQRNPSGNEAEWLQAAIESWERDNR